jgi:catechol 2,3-dioxygenase-like lactoylglutathione lyase family enzyme
MRVSHVMLGVSSVEQSLPFYRDKLGMKVQHQIPGFAFLDGGSLTLALSEEIWRSMGKTAGAMELVLAVSEVKASYAAMRERGVAFVNEPRVINGREWAANFRDPDGHLLSIFGPPGE